MVQEVPERRSLNHYPPGISPAYYTLLTPPKSTGHPCWLLGYPLKALIFTCKISTVLEKSTPHELRCWQDVNRTQKSGTGHWFSPETGHWTAHGYGSNNHPVGLVCAPWKGSWDDWIRLGHYDQSLCLYHSTIQEQWPNHPIRLIWLFQPVHNTLHISN